MLIELSSGAHPAEISIFEDGMSLLHVMYGVMVGISKPPYNDMLLALFTGYQVSQAATKEPWSRTGGEFVELAIGIGLSKVVKR